MTLQINEINKDYFSTTRDKDRSCTICQNSFKDDPKKCWVAHENPDSTKYGVITRSFFQYIHPIHKDCYEELKNRSELTKCPECRLVIGNEGNQIERTNDEEFALEEERLTNTFHASYEPLSSAEFTASKYFLISLGLSLTILKFGTSFFSKIGLITVFGGLMCVGIPKVLNVYKAYRNPTVA